MPRRAPRSCPAASRTALHPQYPAARLPAYRALRVLRGCPAAQCARSLAAALPAKMRELVLTVCRGVSCNASCLWLRRLKSYVTNFMCHKHRTAISKLRTLHNASSAATNLQVRRRICQVVSERRFIRSQHIAMAEHQQRALEHVRAKVRHQAAHRGLVRSVEGRRNRRHLWSAKAIATVRG